VAAYTVRQAASGIAICEVVMRLLASKASASVG
jgi:hypothetical protein